MLNLNRQLFDQRISGWNFLPKLPVGEDHFI
jgi:hypothetical protein